jgi:hypothetical protein
MKQMTAKHRSKGCRTGSQPDQQFQKRRFGDKAKGNSRIREATIIPDAELNLLQYDPQPRAIGSPVCYQLHQSGLTYYKLQDFFCKPRPYAPH